MSDRQQTSIPISQSQDLSYPDRFAATDGPWLVHEDPSLYGGPQARFFNTTGPCFPGRHYLLPTSERLCNAQLDRYLRNKLYWVLHAPRQTGKTTFLMSWMHEINTSRKAVACYVTIEQCQGYSDPALTNQTICHSIIRSAQLMLAPCAVPVMPDVTPSDLVASILTQWAGLAEPLPLVVLFDEVDVLSDQPMVSFLRQLRSGFMLRGVGKFPVSIALVGMRNLRDYLIRAKDGTPVNPGSPFNVKQDSASLGNFTREDIWSLINQHVSEKGQPFEPDAIDLVYELTRGQPWLVNALAQKCVWTLVPEETRAPVTAAHVRQAKEILIQDRAVHLDSLSERLRDPRVRRVVEAVLVGKTDATIGRSDRDVEFCMDLGLIAWDNGLCIANPIYREVIARTLSQNMQDNVFLDEFPWRRTDGSLDLAALLHAFQAFWRRHSDEWERVTDYPEAFPHLLLMAFLQRILNGKGRVEREYAAGRGRIDLAIEWQGRWSVIEIKLVHPADGFDTTVAEGLVQASRYGATLGAAEIWLVVFDRRPAARARPWEERLTWAEHPDPTDPERPHITVVGA